MKYPAWCVEKEESQALDCEKDEAQLRQQQITEKRSKHMSIINIRRKARSQALLAVLLLMDQGCYLDTVSPEGDENIDRNNDPSKPRSADSDYFKNEINVYRAVHIGKLFGISPNKRIFSQLKKPKGHQFNYKLQDLINVIENDKRRYEKRLLHTHKYFLAQLSQKMKEKYIA